MNKSKNVFNNTGVDFPLLEKEDAWVQNRLFGMDCMHRHNNSYAYVNYIEVPDYYKQLKRFDHENKIIFPFGSQLCDKNITRYRGQNNVVPTTIEKRSFLLETCPKDSFQNYLICDSKKCCSKSHQLFMNHTKQGTGKYSKNYNNI
jgi:hypothetical protein